MRWPIWMRVPEEDDHALADLDAGCEEAACDEALAAVAGLGEDGVELLGVFGQFFLRCDDGVGGGGLSRET